MDELIVNQLPVEKLRVFGRAKCPVLIARIPDEEMVRAGLLEA